MARKTVQAPVNPILIGDLPRAENDALATFDRLPGNTYQNATIGRAHGMDEGTACDCVYHPGRSKPEDACGEASNCINRLTLVECSDDDCPSGRFCQNQRFQRRQYANVSIVQTEHKGFGLRAESQIAQDAFIYEYVGEVVAEKEFIRRMGRYAQEGIRHFYFMMLQKEQFIDATKKGDIGRFANHSCNPNCYVSKWHVGNKVRMGIFAKRTIYQHEELTFNYNVDRYGHDAQTCYCGEPNCVGFIGGKTQTDIGGMDDLYIEALGIMDDVEKYTLKGTKRKKGRKLDEDYLPPMHPIQPDEVPTVLQALRQASSSNAKMLPYLLNRLELTTDADSLRNVMRLRGFSLIHSLLSELKDDKKLVKMMLVASKAFPLVHRNKVEDSKIEEPLNEIIQSGDEELAPLAQELIVTWAALPLAYRIPRREVTAEDIDKMLSSRRDERAAKRARIDDAPEIDDAPIWNFDFSKPMPPPPPPEVEAPPILAEPRPPPPVKGPSQKELTSIIERATQAAREKAEAEAQAKAAEEEAAEKKRLAKEARKARAERKKAERERREKRKAQKEKDRNGAGASGSSSSKPVDKDKILLKLVGELVVKSMSHYKDRMEYETFKKHAKELTHLIAEKEKKSSSYQAGTLTSLSDEKRAKMKKFIVEYVKKLLKHKSKSSSSSSRPHPHPNGNGASTSSISLLPSGSQSQTPEAFDEPPGDGPAPSASLLADVLGEEETPLEDDEDDASGDESSGGEDGDGDGDGSDEEGVPGLGANRNGNGIAMEVDDTFLPPGLTSLTADSAQTTAS